MQRNWKVTVPFPCGINKLYNKSTHFCCGNRVESGGYYQDLGIKGNEVNFLEKKTFYKISEKVPFSLEHSLHPSAAKGICFVLSATNKENIWVLNIKNNKYI